MGRQKAEKISRRFTAQSFCRMNERLEFAKQLVDSARDQDKAQEVFAFFCYFVAFNILYGMYECPEERQWQAVRRFLESELCDSTVHPGNDVRFPLLNGKVLSGRKSTSDGDNEKEYIRDEKDPDIKVFLRILQIRNNLFHGSKDLNDKRDMPLIREANVVLKLFLDHYFERRCSSLNDQSVNQDMGEI